MRISGGAAGWELHFGGVLSRDAQVSVETGLSGVEISVPPTTASRIFAETTLAGWMNRVRAEGPLPATVGDEQEVDVALVRWSRPCVLDT